MILKEAEELALDLIKKHCPEYTFKWTNAISQFGVCYNLQKWICLSKPLTKLNDESQVKDTILHEIAHALEPTHHHDSQWRKTAISIGCSGERTYKDEEVITPPKKYTATCSTCGHSVQRNRIREVACRGCCNKYNNGQFSKKFILKWKINK